VIDDVSARGLEDPEYVAAPDLIEPVVGFRSWRAVNGRLRSPYMPVFWDDRRLCAQCSRSWSEAPPTGDADRDHVAPEPGCSCGIYAYFEPDRQFPTVDYRAVTGIVTLWGGIQVHREGMRAEHAQIEALTLYSRWSTRQKRVVWTIAEQLGVDLVDLDEIEDAAERYGGRLEPERLLGESA
jgi:hypothetical protein